MFLVTFCDVCFKNYYKMTLPMDVPGGEEDMPPFGGRAPSAPPQAKL